MTKLYSKFLFWIPSDKYLHSNNKKPPPPPLSLSLRVRFLFFVSLFASLLLLLFYKTIFFSSECVNLAQIRGRYKRLQLRGVRIKCNWENLMEDLMEKLLLLSKKFPLIDADLLREFRVVNITTEQTDGRCCYRLKRTKAS